MLEGKLNPTKPLSAVVDDELVLFGSITGIPILTGFFSGVPQLTGLVSSSGTISASLQAVPEISGRLSVVTVTDAEPYEGEYEVLPRTDSQTIPVKSKLMKRDLTVDPIPFYETSNPTGTTVYIGG